MSAGKGDKPRPVCSDGWENSKLWDHIEQKKKKEEEAQKKALEELSGDKTDEQ